MLEIRNVGVEEILANDRAKKVTFLEDPAVAEAQVGVRAGEWEPERAWAAVQDGQFVATLRTLARSLTVPGAGGSTLEVGADALTGVTVAATHRRRGLLREMLGRSLDAAVARGDAVSILIAAQWEIYGRFGYWPASQWSDVRVDRQRPGAVIDRATTGTVRQLTVDQMRAAAPGVFEAARRGRAGQIDRTPAYWGMTLAPEFREPGATTPVYIAHEGDAGIDGLLTWHPQGDWDFFRHATIVVDDLYAADQSAHTALWAYLCGIDVVDTVEANRRPVDEPARWLLRDGRTWRMPEQVDALWLRLLDVPAALSARRYAVADRLVVDVVDDDHGSYAAGRFELDGGPDGASCVASTRTPDLRLSQRALASVYLGQPALRLQQLAGLVDEQTAGAVQRADLMFATTLLPWSATMF